MANITKRTGKNGVSYQIRVSCGYGSDGRQIVKRTTWKPADGMTEKQIQKELNRFAVDYENKVMGGMVAFDSTTKFSEYADKWLENAQIADLTKETYKYLLVRINQAIGHMRLSQIQSHHLESFYRNLREDGVKNGGYAVSLFTAGKYNLDTIITEKKITRQDLATLANIAPNGITVARRGEHISVDSAVKIAAALNAPVEKIFKLHESAGKLSDKSIIHHHRLISTILSKAKKERLVPHNVAIEHTAAPRITKKEPVYLDDIQAQNLVELLLSEDDIRTKTSVLMLLYSGVRRGELAGLSWPDIDFERHIIHIRRASQWKKGKGAVEVPTKNESSVRSIKLPPWLFDILGNYRTWWLMQKVANGSKWRGTLERLFIQDDGLPISPDTINFWLRKFIEKNNLPAFTPHSLRHTFVSLQIAAGVNIRTLQARTGHAQLSTLTDIYSHQIKTADEIAAEALDDMLTPKGKKRYG